MSVLSKLTKAVVSTAVGLTLFSSASVALAASHSKVTTIRVQSVISAKADEVVMLKNFAQDVSDLTGGSVKIDVLPAGAVVGVKETLDAVDKGLVEGGFAWTHYWSGKHPAAMLFGSPVAGAGVGIDNIAFILKKAQSMLLSGVVQSQTVFSVSRKYLSTITYKVFIRWL